jgi:hypothetical protein
MLASGTAGYEAGGVPGAIGAALLGRGFKMANNRSVLNQANRVAQNIRMRSPLGQRMQSGTPQPTSPASLPIAQPNIIPGLATAPPAAQVQASPPTAVSSASRIRGMRGARDQALQNADRHDFMLNANINDRGYALTPEEQNTYRDLARSARMTAAMISRELERL